MLTYTQRASHDPVMNTGVTLIKTLVSAHMEYCIRSYVLHTLLNKLILFLKINSGLQVIYITKQLLFTHIQHHIYTYVHT